MPLPPLRERNPYRSDKSDKSDKLYNLDKFHHNYASIVRPSQDDQTQSLQFVLIQEMIARGEITLAQAPTFGYEQRETSMPQSIRGMIKDGLITLEQARTFGYEQRETLTLQPIRDMIKGGQITLEQACAFRSEQRETLTLQPIRDMIDNGLITLEQACAFGYEQRETLTLPPIREMIENGLVTLEQACAFEIEQRETLTLRPIREMIENGLVTLEQACTFGHEQRETLTLQSIRDMIDNGQITLEQACSFKQEQRDSLQSRTILKMIGDGVMTFAQACALTYDQLQALQESTVQKMLSDRVITLAQACNLGYEQCQTLKLQFVQEMLADRTMTFAQACRLGEEQLVALEDTAIRQRLREGGLTIAQIMGDLVPDNINTAQSTHNAAVHQSASESAARLASRYQLMIDGPGLEAVISAVQSCIERLPDDSPQNKAAKRCVARITAPDYTFTDPGSNISTRQLLALAFLAIQDDSKRMGTLEDAVTQFMEGLYEVQRGYNLSATGLDQDKRRTDMWICAAGTFSKLIEKLQGVDPDCQIHFISSEMASLKLPVVVREEAMRYLNSLASPDTVADLRASIRLISHVKEEGVEVIWNQIKANVADRMFDEFGSLYQGGRGDQAFKGLIEQGQYTALPDVSVFQAQFQNAKGYRQFCGQMLRQWGMFSAHKASAEYLSEHRHDSPEAQREYDQRLGLVLRSP